MLKVIGAGFLGGGVSLLCFIYPAAKGERWPAVGAVLVGASVWGPTLYVTALLRQASPGAETPMAPSVLILLLIVVAAVLLWRGNSPPAPGES
jgi:drug/metabolite transporter (DMT)-like permease